MAAAAVGDVPYLFGGCTVEDVCSDELYAFHTSTSSWEFLYVRGDAPSARGGASLNAVRGSLVLFGGESSDGTYNEIYKFDTTWRKWYIGVGPENFRPGSGETPPPREGATLTYLNGHLFLFGGYGAGGHSALRNGSDRCVAARRTKVCLDALIRRRPQIRPSTVSRGSHFKSPAVAAGYVRAEAPVLLLLVFAVLAGVLMTAGRFSNALGNATSPVSASTDLANVSLAFTAIPAIVSVDFVYFRWLFLTDATDGVSLQVLCPGSGLNGMCNGHGDCQPSGECVCK
ncbi:hypothetical protein, conserved [Eimeria praecox]|uniref:Kelch motif domain-containing protein n=1 Tax=Eimeria praecox TaxID=51316 RepID=U6G4R1_9EIME|nr:hypothetical protein, conserved [Eimeria praecox]